MSSSESLTGRSYGDRRCFLEEWGPCLCDLDGSCEETGVEISLCWVEGE